MRLKVANIVFYKNDENEKRACVFYKDGSVEDVDYNAGLDICEEIVKERKITSKDTFKNLINNEIVHVMSEEDLKRNFNRLVQYNTIKKTTMNEVIEDHMNNLESKKDANENIIYSYNSPRRTTNRVNNSYNNNSRNNSYRNSTSRKAINEDVVVNDNTNEKSYVLVDKKETKEEKKNSSAKDTWTKIKIGVTTGVLTLLAGMGLYSCAQRISKEGFMANSNIRNTTTIDLDNQDHWFYQTPSNHRQHTSKDSSLIDNNTAVCIEAEPIVDNSNTCSKNLINTTCSAADIVSFYNEGTDSMLVLNNNDYYYDYSYDELLAVTQNNTQKNAMTSIKNALINYNEKFANAYIEKGKDIRAVLTFDEVIALQQAYNNYTEEELMAIFNGTNADARKMANDYKNATLQLISAHIIENSKNPINMSDLINSKEGKDFYQRYHQMFLAAKESKGSAQLANVKAFFDAVRKDFPIPQNGKDAYSSVESYKLSVIPMIAASEMLFQNLEVDYTLTDEEMKSFKDIGCNAAFSDFQTIEKLTAACCPDDCKNPLYEQYKDAVTRMIIKHGLCSSKDKCVIDEKCRQLSKLKCFEDTVIHYSVPVEEYEEWFCYYEGAFTFTEVETWTEEQTSIFTFQQRVEAPMPEEVKQQIDYQIELENEQARIIAEQEAEIVRQQIQAQEDLKAEQIYQEIIEEEADLQRLIDNANAQIQFNQDELTNNDSPINETDFGYHNVDFYQEYEDGYGNLEPYVENITTDPTGDQTGQPLPDPNETGAAFDASYQEYQYPTEFVDVTQGDVVEYETPSTNDYTSYDYTNDFSGTGVETYSGQDYTSYDYTSDFSGTGVETYGTQDYSSYDYTSDFSGTGVETYGTQDYSSYDYSGYGYGTQDYSSYDYSGYGYGTQDYSSYDYSGVTNYSEPSYVEYVSDNAYIEYPSDFSVYYK